jgi:K(+)-stimulated pyrophosphate-energized sodium pump
MKNNKNWFWGALVFALLAIGTTAYGSEAELKLPPLDSVHFPALGGVSGYTLMLLGIGVCALAALFGIWQYIQTKNLPVHESMQNVSNIIWETCKSYLFQQGKFLAGLWVLIGVCIFYYFASLQHMPLGSVVVILLASILGILGSYGVAWFGMRINTQANSRSAFAALTGLPWGPLAIPMRSGMSVGMLLITVELFFMICILTFLPRELTGPCFIGFAIGESLGASALRICGGIFTKIADIGSDLMKIVFKLPEDDPKNPGVIADCTGDNAGDSVGPTADGFETYGVTGVALISFLALTLGTSILCAQLITWIFVMRIMMIITSLVAYFITDRVFTAKYSHSQDFHPELPLTWLVWITSAISIGLTFVVSKLMLGDFKDAAGVAQPDLWWVLAIIISCGTAAGALIPEFTKVFTSTEARHTREIVTASRQGGSSLNILSGFVAGNFSAFWEGLLMLALMLIAAMVANNAALKALMPDIGFAPPIFAFGLVAFGFLGMGPVTIAVDSFGPVSDNAQSVYELSQIESIPNVAKDIESRFGFKPEFEKAKHNLEKNDGAGNTFKATAKPVLIGTAVVGATTMLFAIILLLNNTIAAGKVVEQLSLVQPAIVLGLLAGGAVIYWFTGASCQAVVTGAYRAVVYIKENMDLSAKAASIEDSKEVVKICTIYAQKGMINIFVAIFCFSLALAFFDSYFFIGYLISIAFFGLYQAIFMANAGGAWDNAKKIVEVDLRQKGTELHAASVVGDTVGDPFKDTSSVAMNPIIKFTTLFGLLATEIAVAMQRGGQTGLKTGIAVVLFIVALIFVYRSFYGMRIPEERETPKPDAPARKTAPAQQELANAKR